MKLLACKFQASLGSTVKSYTNKRATLFPLTFTILYRREVSFMNAMKESGFRWDFHRSQNHRSLGERKYFALIH